MSGRRRRSETIWDDKEEQRASAEIYPNISPGRSGYWSKSEPRDDSMHGNFSRSPSRNHLRGYRNGPRDDDIRRDRNRMYSHPTSDGWEKQYSTRPSDESYDLPYRSRDKGVGGNARMSLERERERSRSPLRSRSREQERSRSRDCVSRNSRENTRGPRHETDASYPNMRNSSRDFVSRGGDNNTTESWNSRTDYKGGGSRYNDHRNTRMPPCKFFAAGNCNRDSCKFSHDIPEPARGYDDNRNLGNKNRAWDNDQQPRDSYAGGFNETSHQDHTSDDNNNNTWDSWDDKKKSFDGHASRDASGFHDVGKSHPNVDDKRSSWNGPTSDDNNNNTWDSWVDKEKSFDGHASRDASGFHDVGKSHPNVDNKRSSWNGPTSWDDVSGSGFSCVSNPCRKYEEPLKESLNNSNAKGGMIAKSGGNIDGNKTKKWDGPPWDEFSEPVVGQNDDNNNSNNNNNNNNNNAEMVINDTGLNNADSEDANRQILTAGKDLIPNVHDMNTSCLDGSEQRQMLLSNPYNGPINGHGVHMENQNTEGGNVLKPLEMDVPQSQAVNDVNDTSLTSQLAPQSNAIPQLYPESHLASAIDYLKSLPSSAYNQDTKAKEEQDSVIQQNRMADNADVMKTEAIDKRVAENVKKEEENTKPDNGDAHCKVEEGDTGNDEKAMRLFKAGLVEFVKEILKPKWKEGKMSRDVYKTVVKKVVEKVTSTIQGTQIPRTQPKIDQYLTYSKPKITKLVEAYMEKLLKS